MVKVAETFCCVVIFLVAVLIVLFVPYYPAASDSSFGKWAISATSDCQNSKQTVTYNCIPNSLTNRGCQWRDFPNQSYVDKHQLTGQTYDSVVLIQDCLQQPNSSRWEETNVGTCQYNPESPFGSDQATIKTTYSCVKVANSGLNACQYFGSAFYGGPSGSGAIPTWTVANVGDTYARYQRCTLPNANDFSGQWVVVNPEIYTSLPHDTLIPSQNVDYRTAPVQPDTYFPRNECWVPPGQVAENSLKEGSLNYPVGCLANDQLYFPSDQATPTANPQSGFDGCRPYLEDPVAPSNFSVCRYLPVSLEPITEIDDLASKYGIMILPTDDVVTAINLPVSSGTVQAPLINATNLFTQFNTVSPLNTTPLVTFQPPGEDQVGCTPEDVILASSTKFIMAFREQLVGNVFKFQIGLLLDSGVPGWMGVDDEGMGRWIQSRQVAGGPGLLSDDAAEFKVTLIQSGDSDGPFTPGSGVQGWYEMTIQTMDDQDVYAQITEDLELVPQRVKLENVKLYLFHLDSNNFSNYRNECNIHRHISS